MSNERCCEECGATVGSVAEKCWLCHCKLPDQAVLHGSQVLRSPVVAPDASVTLVLVNIALLALVSLVGIGSAQLGWDALLVYAVLVLCGACVCLITMKNTYIEQFEQQRGIVSRVVFALRSPVATVTMVVLLGVTAALVMLAVLLSGLRPSPSGVL